VRIATDGRRGPATAWRAAEPGEKGELVITQPYPYLARTIWGDAEHLGSPSWRGDIERFREVYFTAGRGLAYTQGDYARAATTTARFTLHGRSDDVINVSGHRIGTEEIEGAILRDKTLRKDSPVGNVVVVGAPHDEKGETPVAFLIPAPGARLGDDDLARLQAWCAARRAPRPCRRTSSWCPPSRKRAPASTCAARCARSCSTSPWATCRRCATPRWSTRSAIGRRLEGLRPLRGAGDRPELPLPARREPRARARSLRGAAGHRRAAGELPERALPGRAQHRAAARAHQDEIEAVVITGARNAFVAGADVKELLEVGEAGDLESAQTPPNAAHTAFSTLENLGKPVIAAVNGPALGGGNELVLACAYVVADGHARFGQPEINLNLLPGYGGTQRLPRRLHSGAATTGLVDAVRLILRPRHRRR
jgi:acrylyl-CoA reductase (NADPH)/3-hydroxypropionyl-CoA dehydratase/3-hydroxypropionyl-CoA synthetase